LIDLRDCHHEVARDLPGVMAQRESELVAP